jgi:hypothetical protein
MWVGEVLPLIIRRRHVMISDLSLSLARSLQPFMPSRLK